MQNVAVSTKLSSLEPCAGRAAAAAVNLWAPPPIFDEGRAAANNLFFYLYDLTLLAASTMTASD